MKIKCIKESINLDKIRFEIDNFREYKGKNPSYIIMNYETHDAIEHMFKNETEGNGLYIAYKEELFGIEVALSAGLKFGEVDIV